MSDKHIITDMGEYALSERFLTLAGEYPEYTPGRVLCQEKGLYRIITQYGEQTAEISGRLQHEARTPSDYPAVGDFVVADLNDMQRAVIHHILPRKSVFFRRAAGTGNTEQVVAANIDTVFICMSLNNDFNLRRLERYLSVTWDSGAMPVVILTKADLCPNVSEMVALIRSAAIGVDILTVTALEREGYEQLLRYIRPGLTVALMGSSGVGKSTLINRLLGEERFETNSLRNDDKGRHTTTHRELLLLPGGGVVIDTPGMRELGLWNAEQGLKQSFSDIDELSRSCRFSNCTHSGEPGCAVSAALDSGALDRARWASYLKLSAEEAFSRESSGYLAAKEQKMKRIAQINRAAGKKR